VNYLGKLRYTDFLKLLNSIRDHFMPHCY